MQSLPGGCELKPDTSEFDLREISNKEQSLQKTYKYLSSLIKSVQLKLINKFVVRHRFIFDSDWLVPPTGVEPMAFRTPVGRSTTELQETRGS